MHYRVERTLIRKADSVDELWEVLQKIKRCVRDVPLLDVPEGLDIRPELSLLKDLIRKYGKLLDKGKIHRVV